MKPIFITGIDTGIGKTLVSAILTQALGADYWKPVQAGREEGTDSEWVRKSVENPETVIHPETYLLKQAASPHIAARSEKRNIDLERILLDFAKIRPGDGPGDTKFLVIEGAGGLLSPLNEEEFVVDLIRKIRARVILVSRNYLGSINHSLLTAAVCRQYQLDVAGWIFNDRSLGYEEEIAGWSKFPRIGSIPFAEEITASFIRGQAMAMRPLLLNLI